MNDDTMHLIYEVRNGRPGKVGAMRSPRFAVELLPFLLRYLNNATGNSI